jgi:hypothetical protein
LIWKERTVLKKGKEKKEIKENKKWENVKVEKYEVWV